MLQALARGAPRRPDPPRRQARERHPARGRHGQGRRLRPGPRRDEPRPSTAQTGRAPRHRGLPLARAGRARHRRRPQRRVRRRADALRDAHRHQGLHRRHPHPRRLPARARRRARPVEPGRDRCRPSSTRWSRSRPPATPTSARRTPASSSTRSAAARAALTPAELDRRPRVAAAPRPRADLDRGHAAPGRARAATAAPPVVPTRGRPPPGADRRGRPPGRGRASAAGGAAPPAVGCWPACVLLARSPRWPAWFFTAGPGRHAPCPGGRARPGRRPQQPAHRRHLTAKRVDAFDEKVGQGPGDLGDPGAGHECAAAPTVVLTVSKGPERYAVPDLRRQHARRGHGAARGEPAHGRAGRPRPTTRRSPRARSSRPTPRPGPS